MNLVLKTGVCLTQRCIQIRILIEKAAGQSRVKNTIKNAKTKKLSLK